MKKFTIVAGIDVSKLKLDVSILVEAGQKHPHYFLIENDRKGILKLFGAMEKLGISLKEVLFCFEHTGIYTMHLCSTLQEFDFAYSMVPAIEIKRSVGLVRGKSDRADSRTIALYAITHTHKLNLTALPERALMKLKLLLVEKQKHKKAILSLSSTDEQIGFMPKELLKDILVVNQQSIKKLKTSLMAIDEMITELVNSHGELKEKFDLVCSVPGIGRETALYLIMYTKNFTCFDNWRQMACYAGIAPFGYSSGSSIKGRSKVSMIANRKLKSLLTLGALAAIRHDKQIKDYYQRKVEEGKNKMLVINAVRCKMISRAFAVINRGNPFIDTFKFAA